ncbi:LOW QUALITY PROTEIN: hypothetical protein ACHAW5_005732 [Stephanodiscus triporus]|uniref:Protein xylosyltransferase n=1 Tax=Stephanodiscus triporus TaxID=2934178 RepID=A0ABD3P366_9STRA
MPSQVQRRNTSGWYPTRSGHVDGAAYRFGLDYYDEHPDVAGREVHDNPHAFAFHKLVHMASTTYPLASNTEIRDTLASHPLDANFLHIILKPNNPTPSVWNYFVECDDALHRIYRLPALNKDRGNGVDIYTSSQWFITSRDFAWYLASPPKDSFYYLKYIEHVVVADEAVFWDCATAILTFCVTLHNDNFLHLQFDPSHSFLPRNHFPNPTEFSSSTLFVLVLSFTKRWENEAVGRDERKCILKTAQPLWQKSNYDDSRLACPVLVSGDLFARKFDDASLEPFDKGLHRPETREGGGASQARIGNGEGNEGQERDGTRSAIRGMGVPGRGRDDCGKGDDW